MNNVEKMRILRAGLEAACRWNEREMRQHASGKMTSAKLLDDHYDETYIADIAVIRRALALEE